MALFPGRYNAGWSVLCGGCSSRYTKVYTVILNRTLSGDSYQFLQQSEIPTYHFQPSLRRLPIPKLNDTCERYLKGIHPLVTEAEFANTTKLVRDFKNGEGIELQKELIAWDKEHKHTSYISDTWFDMYLRDRVPLANNYNPFLMFSRPPSQDYNDQLAKATNFTVSIGRFKRSLDAELLDPEVFHMNPKKSNTKTFRRLCRTLPSSLSWFGAAAFKAFPLDMNQYSSMFNGSRIPKREKDQLYNDKHQRHFIVMRRGHLFAVDMFDQNGSLLRPEAIHAALDSVLKTKLDPVPSDQAVGTLTLLDRITWADARAELEKQNVNKESLQKIDGGVFALCLDDLDTTDPFRLIQSLLCGDDGGNRWYDKCFQLIIDANANTSVNFEHSWGDGVAVLRMMEETQKDTGKNQFIKPGQQPDASVASRVRKLEFSVPDSVRSVIRSGREKHMKICSGLNFSTIEYNALNRDSIKAQKLSPDSVMQLAIQMAFHKLYGSTVPTYESCSTAAFLRGRTEVVRSATEQTVAAVQAFEKKQATPGRQLKKLLVDCSNAHGELVKNAAMGQGFDRHLMGLRTTADRLNRKKAAVFEDPVYSYVNKYQLSTSTLSTETIGFGSFGPVVPNGYGVAYNVIGTKLGGVVSAYTEHRDATKFSTALCESLDEMRNVMKETVFTS